PARSRSIRSGGGLDRRHRQCHRPRTSKRRHCHRHVERWIRRYSPEAVAGSRVTSADFRISREGDSTLIVEFDERIDPAVNARAIRLADAIQYSGIEGVRDVVPTYRSVSVFFDPLRTSNQSLVEWVTRAVSTVPDNGIESSPHQSAAT